MNESSIHSGINVFNHYTQEHHRSSPDLSNYDRVIYVDAENGSDQSGSGDGSMLKPFKTLLKALSVVNYNSNEAIFMLPGIYEINSLCDMFDCYGVDFIGSNEKTRIHITGRRGSSNALDEDAKNNFYNMIIATTSTTPQSQNLIRNHVSKAWDIGFYNVVFDIYSGSLTGTMIGNHQSGSGSLTIIKEEFINVSVLYNERILSAARVTNPQNIRVVNCATTHSELLSPDHQAIIGEYSHSLTEVTFGNDYVITFDGWKHTGKGKNPDGTQANIGVYGGEYAWGLWEIYGYQIGSNIIVPYTSSIESSVNIFSHYVKEEIRSGIEIDYNRVIYVDSIRGSDQDGDGSELSPYSTIIYAIDRSKDGNAILINGEQSIDDFNILLNHQKRLDFYGVGGETNILINGRNPNSVLNNSSGKLIRFYGLTFTLTRDLISEGTVSFDSSSHIYNHIFYNCVFDFSNYDVGWENNGYVYWGYSSKNIINLSFYNCLMLTKGDYFFDDELPPSAYLVNCGTNKDMFKDRGDTFDGESNLINITFDPQDYSIASLGWEHSGTGVNPDGTQAHIGVYGGEYAWGLWEIYGYQIKSNFYVRHRLDIPSFITINPNGWMEGRFGVLPIYFEDVVSYIEVKEVSQIISSISIYPHNSMSGIFDVVPPPRINIQLSPVKDAFVREKVPRLNYGMEEQLAVGTESGGDSLRSFIQFDLSPIPENQRLDKAELWLYYDQYDASAIDVDIYNVLEEWDEYGITWAGQPSSGDRVTEFQAGNTSGYIKIDILPLVKKWYSGDIDNFGLMLKSREESTTLFKLFYSKENRQNLPPILDIEYFDPAVKSMGRWDMVSSGNVRRSENSDLVSSFFVDRIFDSYDFSSSVHILNPSMIESFIVVTRKNMWSSISVRQEGESLLLTELRVLQSMSGDIDSKIVISRPMLNCIIRVRLNGENDFRGYITIRRNESDDLDGTITISRHSIESNIEIVYSNIIEGSIRIVVGESNDIHSNVTIRQSDSNDLLGNIEIWKRSILNSEIKVISGYLRSNIRIPYEDYDDLLSRIHTRVRFASDIPTMISLYYESDIVCYIFVDEEKDDYQYVFII